MTYNNLLLVLLILLSIDSHNSYLNNTQVIEVFLFYKHYLEMSGKRGSDLTQEVISLNNFELIIFVLSSDQ